MTRNGNGEVLTRRPGAAVGRDLWNEFETMNQQMDNLFGQFFSVTPLPRLVPNAPKAESLEFSPDIFETPEELVFVLPLPGVDPNAIQIEATADTLSLRGKRQPFYQNEKATRLRQSLWAASTGTFQMNYSLPVEVQAQNIQAHYRNGVLELHLPKAEAVKPRAIKINVQASEVPTLTAKPAEEPQA